MELSYNGRYGYTGDDARRIFADQLGGNLVHWAALVARSFPSQEQKEAMVLAAYPALRGDPRHDSTARQ